jgi:EPS-associated MarR family transcriptional regulator
MKLDNHSLATPMPARQTLIQEDTSYRILRILQANPEINQRELARHLGMSLGGLNYCLRALMDKGYVKLDNFQNSKHRFKYVYLLTPAGLAQKVAMTSRFLKRKMDEYEALRTEIETLKAEVGAGETAAEGRAATQLVAPTTALQPDRP